MRRSASAWSRWSRPSDGGVVKATLGRVLRRSVVLRAGEGGALVWSTVYHFLVLAAYFVIRPIRDEMGVAGGVENLAWLFTGTLVGMLLLHPVFAALVARYPRRLFVPWIYRLFIGFLVVFFALFRWADGSQSVWVGRLFFIWTSVFNLFVVSVFWSFMADLYRPGQAKRLFGIVAVGGTIGALTGSGITAFLVTHLGPVNLLLVSAAILELAGRASRLLERFEARLEAAGGSPAPKPRPEAVIGGGVLDGMRDVVRSPYLLGIAALMVFFTIVSTFLYFHLMAIVAEAYEDDPIGRTRLFATMEVAVQALTLLVQLFLTGRVLTSFGLGPALVFLPVVSLVGFGILAAAPILVVAVVFQVLRRAGNFAVQRPAREVLYTVLSRTDKYKAKNFNDTFVYRAGDQLGAWSYTALGWLGLGLSGLALAMLPVSVLWIVLADWLGKRYRREGREARSHGVRG
jgi:ATP:ADP antiporter, AAA family